MIRYSALSAAARDRIAIGFLLVVILLFYNLCRLHQQKRSLRRRLPPLLLLLGTGPLWYGITKTSHCIFKGLPLGWHPDPPVPPLLLLLAVLAVIAVGFLYQTLRWERSHISAVSVKESFDSLPTGVCFYDAAGGRPRLTNQRMDRLCQRLTGRPLQDGASFWDAIAAGHVDAEILEPGESPLLRLEDGTVLAFTRYPDGDQYELVASDVTEEYGRTLRLREENRELRAVNRRLREYGDTVTDMVRERELLAAKSGIHDQMNRLLLSTRHGLEEGTEQDIARLLPLWQGNILLMARSGPEEPEDPLAELQELASYLGLTLDFPGPLPPDREQALLVIAAASEAMTNAVRHGNASRLTAVSEGGSVTFTNNGTPPAAPVREGGGLSTLRRRVERAGGTMTIRSAPAYALTITFPPKEDAIHDKRTHR